MEGVGVVILCAFTFAAVSGSHMQGGTISFSAKEKHSNGWTVDFKYKSSFIDKYADYFYWNCVAGDCGYETKRDIAPVDNRTSLPSRWYQYGGNIKRRVHNDKPFQLWEGSCCWVSNRYSVSGWSLLTTVDLGIRSDTNKPNSSPVATPIPILRIPQNCGDTINLMVHDPDGDTVRCRFGMYYGECTGCAWFFGIDQSRCTLTVPPRTSTGSYVLELVIEDFPKNDIYLKYNDGSIQYKYRTFTRESRELPEKSQKYYWYDSTPDWYESTTYAMSTTDKVTAVSYWDTMASTEEDPYVWTTTGTTNEPTVQDTTYDITTYMTESSVSPELHTTVEDYTTETFSTESTMETREPYTTQYYTQETLITGRITDTTTEYNTDISTIIPIETTIDPDTGPTTEYYTTYGHTEEMSTIETTAMTILDSSPQPESTAEYYTTHTDTTESITDYTTENPTHIYTTTESPTSDIYTTIESPTSDVYTTIEDTTPEIYTTTQSTTMDSTTEYQTTYVYPTTESTTPTLHYSDTPTETVRVSDAYTMDWDLSSFPSLYMNSLSQISLQFLVEVTGPAPSCTIGDYRPKFIAPTPNKGERQLINVDGVFQLHLSAQATYESITDFKVSGPPGMTKSVNPKSRSNTRTMIVEWRPKEEDLGDRVPFCFVAETHNGYQSEVRCVIVVVGPKKLVNTVLMCHENTMSLIIEQSPDNELFETSFRLNDPKCLVTSNRTHLIASVGYNSCGTEIAETENDIVFKNQVNSFDNSSSVITRKNGVSIPFNCSFPKKSRLSASFRAHKSDYVFAEAGFGNFTYKFQFYTDDGFAELETQYPLEVTLRDLLYIEIQVSSAVPNVQLFVESCRAAPHDDPNDPVFYDIIKNGCIEDNTLVIYPGTRTQSRFALEAFAFIGSYEEVYISCTVILCKTGDPNTRCNKGCIRKSLEDTEGHRRRRSLVSESQQHFISQGPLRMKSPSPSNKEDSNPLNMNTLVVALSGVVIVAMVAVTVHVYVKKARSAGYERLAAQDC